MPRNILGATPFPLRLLDKDGRVTELDILGVIGDGDAVTLCLRASAGPLKRGGYFFHIRRSPSDDTFQLYDFERNIVATRSLPQLSKFIMHCSGRLFDEDSFALCQSVVNLRQDPNDPD